MKLSIRYKPRCYDRPWLIKRVNGKYGQHAHMRRKKDAVKLRNLLDKNLCLIVKNLKLLQKDYLVKKSIKILGIVVIRHINVLRKNKKSFMGLVEPWPCKVDIY